MTHNSCDLFRAFSHSHPTAASEPCTGLQAQAPIRTFICPTLKTRATPFHEPALAVAREHAMTTPEPAAGQSLQPDHHQTVCETGATLYIRRLSAHAQF